MHDQLGGLLRTVEPDLLFTVRPDGSVVYPPEFDGTFLAGLFSNAIEALPLLVMVTEKLEFQSGQHLWDWLTNSNPIVEMVLAELSLTNEQKATVQQALDDMVRKRAGRSGPAVLTNPINIGIGTK